MDFPVSPTAGALPHTARSQASGRETVGAHVPWKGCPPITGAVELAFEETFDIELVFLPL